MSNKVRKQTHKIGKALRGTAEGSTLTAVMMHLVQPGSPFGGCFCEAIRSAGNYIKRFVIWCKTTEGVTVSNGLGSAAARQWEPRRPGGARSRHPANAFTRSCGAKPPIYKHVVFIRQIRMLSRPWGNGVTRPTQNMEAVFPPLIC